MEDKMEELDYNTQKHNEIMMPGNEAFGRPTPTLLKIKILGPNKLGSR